MLRKRQRKDLREVSFESLLEPIREIPLLVNLIKKE
jgi:hypothetical protein